MLCDACEHLWSTVRQTPPGSWTGIEPELFDYSQIDGSWLGAHHTEPGSFSLAVSQSCYICTTIFRDMSPRLRDQEWSFRTFYQLQLIDVDQNTKHANDHYDLEFTVEILEDEIQQVAECSGTFKILPRNEVTASGEALELTSNTFSGKCKDRVRQWLYDCVNAHAMCRQDWRAEESYSIRLLNIMQEKHFKLETFEAGSRCPQYVTMSHCWEMEMPLVLTSDTESMLVEGLSVDNLPLKFRDAIKIAHWMGIRYIWIDALCIQQDSEEDWLVQSNKMGDIYTNSYCNIAATGKGVDMGCFTERNRSLVEPYPVSSPRSGPAANRLSETHFIGYDDFWSNSLLDTALHKRAWVLQERLLSPRTIHFGQEQIFWECRCKMACEAYPQGIPHQFRNHKTMAWRRFDRMLSSDHKKPSQRQAFWQKYKLSASSSVQMYEIWSKTVERYMECKLTYGEDKLVAISGIAQKFAEASGQRYLAGLWENSMLPQSLLWYVLGRKQADGTPAFRPGLMDSSSYRAPTWSWASLEAKIIWNWPAQCGKILIDICETKTKEHDGSRLGRVSYAAMELLGHLIEGELQVTIHDANGASEENGRYTLRLTNDTKLHAMEPVIYLDTPMMPVSDRLEVCLLPVCTDWRGQSGNLITRLAGLLLKRVYSAPRICYERVGIFGLDDIEMEMIRNSMEPSLSGTQDDFEIVGKNIITLL